MSLDDATVRMVSAIGRAFHVQVAPLAVGDLVRAGTWETEFIVKSLEDRQGIPDDSFVERHFNSLPVFTPAGFRRVLPYYLRYSVLNPDSDATEYLIFHLAGGYGDGSFIRDRVDVLSPAERLVICEYLRFMRAILAGEGYDSHFDAGLAIWGCNSPNATIDGQQSEC